MAVPSVQTHAPPSQGRRIPISRKLVLNFGLLVASLAATTLIAWFTFERIAATAGRLAERESAQLERLSDLEALALRTSLEVNHLMLARTAEDRAASAARVGELHASTLGKLDVLERNVSAEPGRETMRGIRETDAAFWKLAGEVVGKAQAGETDAALAQLSGELVPARDAMTRAVAEQRERQRRLIDTAAADAARTGKHAAVLLAIVGIVTALVSGWMAWSITRMLQGAFQRATLVTRRIAGGDLGQEIYVRKGDEFGSLFSSIVDMQGRLADVVKHVRAVAADIVRSAQAIDAANRDLSAAMHEQTDRVTVTAASAQQVSASVKQTAETTATVSTLAAEASDVASRGGQVVAQVVGTMKGIDESSKRISEIANVIDSIAFQTSILALNAAVEAARAGEHGRGFAVVAAEVRTLAQRSASSAREVKALITDSVQRVESGSELVDQAGQTIEQLVASVHQVTGLVGGIAEATRAQRGAVEQVSTAVRHMDEAARRSAALVDRSNAAAESLRQSAQALETAVCAFSLSRESQQEA